jgi:hypothetical protein
VVLPVLYELVHRDRGAAPPAGAPVPADALSLEGESPQREV